MKKLLLLGSLLFTLTGAGAPLTLHADLKRDSLDLLDPVSIAITVLNARKSPIKAKFPTAHAFDIAVSAPGGKELWRWSATHLSAQVFRTITFRPGRTLLVTYIWDPVLSDGRSLSAGQYDVHVALVDGKYHPSTTVRLRFALPLPLLATHELGPNTEATVSGTLRATRTLMELVDPTGAVTLSKRIAITDPSGPLLVRGFVVKENGGFFLRVERWARAWTMFLVPARGTGSPAISAANMCRCTPKVGWAHFNSIARTRSFRVSSPPTRAMPRRQAHLRASTAVPSARERPWRAIPPHLTS